eukprot:31198-Pelagococcus_subviridis.AAC.33
MHAPGRYVLASAAAAYTGPGGSDGGCASFRRHSSLCPRSSSHRVVASIHSTAGLPSSPSGTIARASSVPGGGAGSATVGRLVKKRSAFSADSGPSANANSTLRRGAASTGCRSRQPTSSDISGASSPSAVAPPQNCAHRPGCSLVSSVKTSINVVSSFSASLCTGSASNAASEHVNMFFRTDFCSSTITSSDRRNCSNRRSDRSAPYPASPATLDAARDGSASSGSVDSSPRALGAKASSVAHARSTGPCDASLGQSFSAVETSRSAPSLSSGCVAPRSADDPPPPPPRTSSTTDSKSNAATRTTAHSARSVSVNALACASVMSSSFASWRESLDPGAADRTSSAPAEGARARAPRRNAVAISANRFASQDALPSKYTKNAHSSMTIVSSSACLDHALFVDADVADGRIGVSPRMCAHSVVTRFASRSLFIMRSKHRSFGAAYGSSQQRVDALEHPEPLAEVIVRQTLDEIVVALGRQLGRRLVLVDAPPHERVRLYLVQVQTRARCYRHLLHRRVQLERLPVVVADAAALDLGLRRGGRRLVAREAPREEFGRLLELRVEVRGGQVVRGRGIDLVVEMQHVRRALVRRRHRARAAAPSRQRLATLK